MRRSVLLLSVLAAAGTAVFGAITRTQDSGRHLLIGKGLRPRDRGGPTDSTSGLKHDCGLLIEGERITWEFEYVNGSDRTIQLLRDEDVRPDCGCSSLTVSRRALGPGERASIRAVVETTGRRGKFTHGGTVTWHDDAGTPIPVQVALSGEVSPVIQVRAGQLTFGAEDIRAGTAKEVTLTSRLPIDWSALSFDVSEPQLFAVSRVGAVENGVRYTVRCLLPPDVESAAAACRVRGRVADSSPTSPGLPVSLDIPLRAEQSVELVAQPRTVLFQFDPAAARYSARVLLRGKAVRSNPDLVESVTAAGCAIDWSVKRPPAGGTAVLELTVARPVGAGTGWVPPAELTVVTRQGYRLTLRAVWARGA